jgi:hypothetical protein
MTMDCIRTLLKYIVWEFVLLGFVVSVGVSNATAQSANYTGRYIDTNTCGKTSALSLDQQIPCFEGAAFAPTNHISLVQNNSKICGDYFECGFANCAKIYHGRVAGFVEGQKLVLYRENGHQSGMEIEAQIYENPTVFSKNKIRLSKLKKSVENLCQPEFPTTMVLDAEGKFDFKGVPKITELMFASSAKSKLAKPPAVKRINLLKNKKGFDYIDARKTKNFIPRQVQISNHTSQAWKIEAVDEWSFACLEYLEGYLGKDLAADTQSFIKTQNLYRNRIKQIASKPNFYFYWSGFGLIGAKSTVTTLICNGEGLRFTPY